MSIIHVIEIAGVILLSFIWWWAWSIQRKRGDHWRAEYLEAQKQIDWKGEEWHALNEEMRVTLEERDEWRRRADARKKVNDEAVAVISRKRELIHRLRIDCQVARVQLRDFCSRPSQMVDILDKLEKDFAEDSKSN